ncbi:hypothetical protein BBJ28_00020089 [Nothophytophthora sp. Chile5]|nr:hypothetical protein BBJ28_00020089 [Nothophytophthora sp. Chile5]
MNPAYPQKAADVPQQATIPSQGTSKGDMSGVDAAYYSTDGIPLARLAPNPAPATCRGCGQTFYRDPKVRPDTNGWYRCSRCARTNWVDFLQASYCGNPARDSRPTKMIPTAQSFPQKAADIPQQEYVPIQQASKDAVTGVDNMIAGCSLCHKQLDEKEIVKQTLCGHLFHAQCLDSYLQTELCCPMCQSQVRFPAVHAAVVHEGRTAGSGPLGETQAARAVPVATAFAPLDGTDAYYYAACRDCGQVFYRDPAKTRPETSAWYRCPRCVEVMYDGWPDDYDEVVRLDSHRVAPYHTYTWVVKCWVKYLNWPLWPSLNLAMEDRLYKKRQVRMFDPNYDKNRKETNGEQFERALECVLQSDATTKMPTFVKGTLPVQYKNTPALSVRKMRKDMGNELWFKNFANNKDRHYQTHIYDSVGVDKGDDDAASEESVLVSKPKSKPKRKGLKDGKSDIKIEAGASRSKKRKVPKIELELEVEEAYELEEMNSSEESDRSETQASVPAKKRLRSKARAAGESLPTPIKAEAKEVDAANHMPRHVTVQLDDIIVDDDDDEDSSESARKKAAKKARKSTVRKQTSSSAPKLIKKESNGERLLLLSESKTSRRETAASGHRELAAKEIDGRARQKHVRRTKSKDAGELHRKAWTAIFSETADRFGVGTLDSVDSFLQSQEEQSDDSGFSESFDPGTTSEEKATSPFDARIGYGDGVLPSIPDIATRDKGKHQDDEDEEKGVPRAFMKDSMPSVDYSTKKGMIGKFRTQLRSKKKRETPAEASVPKRTGPARKWTKGAMPLIEQRIADTQKAIQLDEEKERARAEKENSASSLLLFGSLKVGESEGRRPRQQRSELSLLARVASDQNASSGWSELSAVRRGRVQETAVSQPLQHDHMGHSFLSLEKSYSSDSPEAKDTRSAVEDGAAVVGDDLAVEVDVTTSPAPEKTREKAKRAGRKETSMTTDKEGVGPELGRSVCDMRADMEGRNGVTGHS